MAIIIIVTVRSCSTNNQTAVSKPRNQINLNCTQEIYNFLIDTNASTFYLVRGQNFEGNDYRRQNCYYHFDGHDSTTSLIDCRTQMAGLVNRLKDADLANHDNVIGICACVITVCRNNSRLTPIKDKLASDCQLCHPGGSRSSTIKPTVLTVITLIAIKFDLFWWEILQKFWKWNKIFLILSTSLKRIWNGLANGSERF